jgi:hypothetical protein
MALLVPTPQLQQSGSSSPVLLAEKPIGLLCSPVAFADGTRLTALSAIKSTFLVYRQLFGGGQEVWDDQVRNWSPLSSTIKQQSLFWNDKDQTWRSILVAIGNKDSAGNDTFATNPLTGFPLYTTKCFFSGRDSAKTQQDGQSPASAPVAILAAGQNNHAGLAMDPNDPSSATQIYLFLKDNLLMERGRIAISQDSSGFHVHLTAGGASVVLSDTGEIVLNPASGRAVQVNGDISVSGNVLINGVAVVAP